MILLVMAPSRTRAGDPKSVSQLAMRAVAKATKYEKYAQLIGDPDTARSILELAWKLRKRADTLGGESDPASSTSNLDRERSAQ